MSKPIAAAARLRTLSQTVTKFHQDGLAVAMAGGLGVKVRAQTRDDIMALVEHVDMHGLLSSIDEAFDDNGPSAA